MNRSRLRRAALGAAAALSASAALSSPASAAGLVKTTTDCGTPELAQPFAPWGDAHHYKLVDGGDFESGAAGWQLRGGARVVAGNAPSHVNGAGDAFSLSRPAGSSATSAPVCVSRDEPTMRFFAARNSGLLSTLAVAVQIQLLTGTWVTLPIGLDAGGGWNPSPTMGVLANLLPPWGEQTAVRFVFTPLLGGNWQIDDVFVDPRMRY
jgi:hypothetical protein